MKIKVRETVNTIIPKYVYTGRKNVFNLNVTDKFKYLILPVHITAPTLLKNVTEKPLIQNYASYILTSTTSLPSGTGCSTKFNARTYVFPSWDDDIKLIPGISFGKIKINDFKYLEGITNPNSVIPPC